MCDLSSIDDDDVHSYVYRSMQGSSTLKSWSATSFTKSVNVPIIRCTAGFR